MFKTSVIINTDFCIFHTTRSHVCFRLNRKRYLFFLFLYNIKILQKSDLKKTFFINPCVNKKYRSAKKKSSFGWVLRISFFPFNVNLIYFLTRGNEIAFHQKKNSFYAYLFIAHLSLKVELKRILKE